MLLQVSSGLREKLRDPHFVAARCDLDGSGDLDAHELKPLWPEALVPRSVALMVFHKNHR